MHPACSTPLQWAPALACSAAPSAMPAATRACVRAVPRTLKRRPLPAATSSRARRRRGLAARREDHTSKVAHGDGLQGTDWRREYVKRKAVGWVLERALEWTESYVIWVTQDGLGVKKP